MKTTICNVTIVTVDQKRRIYDNGYLSFEHGVITEIGEMEQVPYMGLAEQVDGKGGILMPGMINTHTHMGMIPFRGLGDDCKDRLRLFLFPMEQKAMDEELVYLSTAYAAGEMLLAGVTTVFDMYYFEKAAAGAMNTMGIRGIAGETVMDENACDFKNPLDALRYGRELMEEYVNHPRISGCVSPHGTGTCSEELLKAAHELDLAFDAPFSLHTAEMEYELAYFKENYDLTPTGYLERIGVLDEHTLAAHCIFMTEADLMLFKERGAGVAHCIGSNTKAAKGVAPLRRMRELGIATGLGTDGPASGNTLDLFTQMKLCANFHKNENHDRSAFPAEEIVALATIGGAGALGMEADIGSLEVGKRADLVLVETESANLFPVYDPYSALVYSANASNVSSVFVEGECLVRDKKLVKCDLAELRRRLADKMNRSAFGEIKQF